jgi:hypothetical protein
VSASLPSLRIAACLGHLSSLVAPDRVAAYDSALISMSEGDLVPAFGLLARANLGMRDDHPAREIVLDAWALLDAVEQEVAA